MDILLLRKAAVQSLALMITVVTLSYAMKQYQLVTIAASDQNSDKESITDNSSVPEITAAPTIPAAEAASEEKGSDTPLTGVAVLKNNMDQEIRKVLGDNFLMIKKPAGSNLSIQLTDMYINKSIQLDITDMTDDILTSDMVVRVRGNDMFSGKPQYKEITTLEVNEEDGTTQEVVTKDFGKDLSQGITITCEQDTAAGLYTARLQITLDSVYVYNVYEDTGYYYIDLRKPSEVYDKILVIDAGHGGKDGGAISKGNKYYEKNINLAILLQLRKLLDKENIKVYYTRTADDKVFLRPRAELANAVDADYFISIHCNANEVTSPNGSEVLYYDNEFKGVKAKDLAAIISEELGKAIPLKQKGIVKRNFEDIFIMDKSIVPTVLIEVGYLTNNKDMGFLSKEENQKAVAQGIFNGILRAYNELPVTK